MRQEAARWFAKAAEDLDTAHILLRAQRPEPAAFHAQQAAEKALKATLIERTGRFPRIHDLVILAQEAGVPKDLTERCGELSQVYLETRYPDVPRTITAERAEDLVSIAQEVITWISERSS